MRFVFVYPLLPVMISPFDFKCPNRALGYIPASSHALFQTVRLMMAVSRSMTP